MSKRSRRRGRQKRRKWKEKKIASEQVKNQDSNPHTKKRPAIIDTLELVERKPKSTKKKKQIKTFESKKKRAIRESLEKYERLQAYMDPYWSIADKDQKVKLHWLRYLLIGILSFPIYDSLLKHISKKYTDIISLFENYDWYFDLMHSKVSQNFIHNVYQPIQDNFIFQWIVHWVLKIYIFIGDSYIWCTGSTLFMVVIFPILSLGFLRNLRKVDKLKDNLIDEFTFKKASSFIGTFVSMYAAADAYLVSGIIGKVLVILVVFATISNAMIFRSLKKEAVKYGLAPSI